MVQTLSTKVVYSDYGGAHSTPLAAAIHLGVMPTDRVPSNKEIMDLPLFDRNDTQFHGCLVLMGMDHDGNEVYVLGRGPSAVSVERAVASGVALAGGDVGCLRFIDTLKCVNLWMRVGGFLSRGVGWTNLGRPLVLHGSRKAYPQLVKLVTEVKQLVCKAGDRKEIVGSDGCELGAVAGHAVKRGMVPGVQDGPLTQLPEKGEEKSEENSPE